MEALVPERERQRTTRARSRSDTPTKVVEVMVTLRGPFVAARGATLRNQLRGPFVAARGATLRGQSRPAWGQLRSLRFSRARTETCTGVPSKPNSSRSLRST